MDNLENIVFSVYFYFFAKLCWCFQGHVPALSVFENSERWHWETGKHISEEQFFFSRVMLVCVGCIAAHMRQKQYFDILESTG